MEKIGVFLVDKQALFRLGMREALCSYHDIEVLAECAPSSESFDLIESFSPDVVIVDVDLPSLGGIDLGRQITRRCPSVSVVVVSSFPDDDQLFQVIKGGAAAYLSKDASPEDLADIVRKAYRGEHPINDNLLSRPNVAERVLRQFQNFTLTGKAMEALTAPLTPRETEILGYIAGGHSNKQIAFRLHITEQTIKNHVTSILRKLNANDRTHAVVLAMRHGWIPVDDRKELPVEKIMT